MSLAMCNICGEHMLLCQQVHYLLIPVLDQAGAAVMPWT